MSPRSSEVYEQIRRESRKRILITALELFATQGYNGTSISQIAKAAGISKGLMYNYFTSKEELLRAIIDMFIEEGEEIFKPNLEGEPIEVLREIFEMYFKLVVEYQSLNRIIMMLALQVHEHFGFIHDIALKKMKSYNLLLSHLLEKTGHPNPVEEAHMITIIFDGIGLQHAILGKDYPLEKMKKYLIEKYCNHKHTRQ